MEQSEFGGAGGGMYNFGKAKVNYCTAKLLAFVKKGGGRRKAITRGQRVLFSLKDFWIIFPSRNTYEWGGERDT